MKIPDEGQIVFVCGGVAQYREGIFYTGMEDPRWKRPIQWEVKWWYPVSEDPYPPELRGDRLLNVARGCHGYNGGYTGASGLSEPFHHGIQTVINALEAASKGRLFQTDVLERIGAKESGE